MFRFHLQVRCFKFFTYFSVDFKTLLSASKPHFLDGDPKLVSDIGGLTPNKKDNDIFIHYDLVSH